MFGVIFIFIFIFLEMPPKVGLGVQGEDKRVAQVLNTNIPLLNGNDLNTITISRVQVEGPTR